MNINKIVADSELVKINCKITKGTLRDLKALAEKKDITFSQVVRSLLRAAVKIQSTKRDKIIDYSISLEPPGQTRLRKRLLAIQNSEWA